MLFVSDKTNAWFRPLENSRYSSLVLLTDVPRPFNRSSTDAIKLSEFGPFLNPHLLDNYQMLRNINDDITHDIARKYFQ